VSAAPRLEVSASHDPRRLEALRPEWSALFDAAAAPSPFLAPEWLVPWWRAFGGRRTPWILEARDRDGALAGLLLLAGGPSPLGLRRWSLLGNGVTGADGLDVLARAPDAAAAREALARAVASAVSAFGQAIRRSSALARMARSMRRSRLTTSLGKRRRSSFSASRAWRGSTVSARKTPLSAAKTILSSTAR
jgi:hypothetical protein